MNEAGGGTPTLRLRGLLFSVAVALAGAAVVIAFLVRSQDDSEVPPVPALLGETPLRAEPRADADIVASLSADTSVDLLGRTEDGSWLMVSPQRRTDPKGWVQLLSIRNAGDLASLPKVALQAPTATPIQATSTPTPVASLTPTSAAALPTDGADVRIQQIGSRGNRLLLVVANVGTTSTPPVLAVTVDNESPIEVDLERQLAPGEAAEIVLNGEYVQRRATVTVAVSTGGEVGTTEANTATAVVSPDQPNDIEVIPPTQASDGHLLVPIRNNSPIPLLGTATISVREAPPSNRLLARLDAPFEMQPAATIDIDFVDVRDVEPTQIQVSVSTDAITDADLGNNNYPR